MSLESEDGLQDTDAQQPLKLACCNISLESISRLLSGIRFHFFGFWAPIILPLSLPGVVQQPRILSVSLFLTASRTLVGRGASNYDQHPPRGSKYPLFAVAGSKTHALNGCWDHRP